jgi:hypothetical protein
MEKKKLEKYKRQAIFSELEGWCLFAKEEDFIEVTDWNNREGFDVEISSKLSTRFQLTWGEWELLKKLVKKIDKI